MAAQAGKSQTLALAEYRGLTVAQLDQLRKNACAQGVYLHVLKNTLARRAVAGTQFEVAAESMSGPLIYGFSEDAVAAAKVIADFAKGNDKLVIKAGAYAGRLWTPMASSPWPRSQARKFCWPNWWPAQRPRVWFRSRSGRCGRAKGGGAEAPAEAPTV